MFTSAYRLQAYIVTGSPEGLHYLRLTCVRVYTKLTRSLGLQYDIKVYTILQL